MKRFLAVSFLFAALAALIYAETEAQAQALQLAKPFTGKVNKAIASSLSKRLNTMGFAANDPIYAATMTASQNVVQLAVVGGSVAATVAAIGSAPVWLSVALGVGAIYEIYDFSMGQFEVKAVTGVPTVAVTSGTVYRSVPVAAGELPRDYSNPGVGVAVVYPNDLRLCASAGTSTTVLNTTYCGGSLQELESMHFEKFKVDQAAIYGANGTVISSPFTLALQSGPTKISCSISPLLCPEGIIYSYSRTYSFSVLHPPSGDTGTVSGSFTFKVFNNPYYLNPDRQYSLNDAASKLTSTDLNSLADPELLAAIANKIWQQAAQQPGYEGAPYDVQNPITASDILADVAAGLYPHPTNYDLLSLPSPDTATAPQLDPAAVPVESASPAGDVSVDFGPDPGIASPSLEDAPSGASVVGLVMGLLPTMSAFTIPQHTAECVMPTFDFFGTQRTMGGACDLLEHQRALLSTLFTAIWGIAALTTVLRA